MLCKLAFMKDKSINQVFAENLRTLMDRKGLNQPGLAEKSKVSQKTISNCLNPGNREDSASGVERSANLTNVGKLAKGLGAEPWQMLRPLDHKQRDFYAKIEDLFQSMQSGTAATSGTEIIAVPETAGPRMVNSKKKTPEKVRRSA